VRLLGRAVDADAHRLQAVAEDDLGDLIVEEQSIRRHRRVHAELAGRIEVVRQPPLVHRGLAARQVQAHDAHLVQLGDELTDVVGLHRRLAEELGGVAVGVLPALALREVADPRVVEVDLQRSAEAVGVGRVDEPDGTLDPQLSELGLDLGDRRGRLPADAAAGEHVPQLLGSRVVARYEVRVASRAPDERPEALVPDDRGRLRGTDGH
jgi:hypothetical protein